MDAMNPSCTGQRSMMLHANASRSPVRSAARQSSFRLEPVVLQENWGYWVKATARSTPSSRHGAERVVALGLDVAEGDVEAVRRGLGREPVQPLDHALALGPGVPEDRRAAADLVVQPADLGGAAPRDERAEPALKRELDDLAVGEQLEQERLDLVERGRPAEVHHDDAGLHLAHAPNIIALRAPSPSSSAIFVSPATV